MFGAHELAGFGGRAGAWLLDILFSVLPILVAFGLIAGGTEAAGGLLLLAGLAWAYLVYFPLTMARGGERNGQTWGKQIVGVRVVRDSGQPFDFGSAALREIVLKGLALGIAGAVIPLIPYLVNYLWPLWDDQNRALHDMVVNTHVVRA